MADSGVDSFWRQPKIKDMSTTTELLADREEIWRAIIEKRPIDPEVAKRVHGRAEQVRARIVKDRGMLDVAVALIREARDE